MAAVPKTFYRAMAPTALASVTVPAGKLWIITNVVAATPTTQAADATVALDDITLFTIPLGAKQMVSVDCKQPLAAGKTVKCSGSVANSVTIHVSGVEMDA